MPRKKKMVFWASLFSKIAAGRLVEGRVLSDSLVNDTHVINVTGPLSSL
jgi:hypothetical protein